MAEIFEQIVGRIETEIEKMRTLRLAASRPQKFRNGPKIKIQQYFGFFSKGPVQKVHIIACLTHLINAYEEKITFDNLKN
jgi:hypothetical protein